MLGSKIDLRNYPHLRKILVTHNQTNSSPVKKIDAKFDDKKILSKPQSIKIELTDD